MMTLDEIENEIIYLKKMDVSRSAVEQLALLVICRDELRRDFKQDRKLLEICGESEFLKSVDGKDATAVWKIIDEIMETLKISNVRMYNAIIQRIKNI